MTDAEATEATNSFAVIDSAEDGPVEIETKLDLVAAYIEMDDEEVLALL